jgi:Ca-activated chloride channel homolog
MMSRRLPDLTERELSLSPPSTDGFGGLSTARGHLPLKALDVSARIEGLLVEVNLHQVFVNNLEEPLEATYIFPLPDRAAVTAFSLTVGKRTIRGVLEERAKARRDYQAAIDAGRRAAIAEEERPNVFTLRVGNILPGEEATASLSLAGPLPSSDGEATFRFPLVVAPRYIPGVPLPGSSVGDGVAVDTDATPDASRITPPVLLPGYPNPVRLSLTVDVGAGLPLGDFRSSLHAVLSEEENGGARRITLQSGERLDRDFILRFKVIGESVTTALSLSPDDLAPAGRGHNAPEGGTFSLTVVPPAAAAGQRRGRDLAFILDRSGSMKGWKMVAARRAMARMVDTLGDADRFTVLAFDNVIETPAGFSTLLQASDRNRFRAVEFLSRIEARGGTEMARPLLDAAAALSGGDPARERILVLVTDGQIGNEDQILRDLGAALTRIRVYTLGIDRAVNEGFLNRLALAGGGASEIVESEDRLDEVMDQIHRRIGSPLLSDLHLEPAGGLSIEEDSIVPARLPGLFSDVPLVILGRYRGKPGGSIVLRATTAGGEPWSSTAPAIARHRSAVAAVWARGRLRDLEDRFVARREDLEALEKTILATSLRFGVLCRFTAFVAIDDSELVNEGGKPIRIVQPVEAPQGWEMPEAPSIGLLAHVGSGMMSYPRSARSRFSYGALADVADGSSENSSSLELATKLLVSLRHGRGKRKAIEKLIKLVAKMARDLEASGIAASRIDRLLRDLREVLARAGKGVDEEARAVAEAEKVLKDFATEVTGNKLDPKASEKPTASRGESFWK